MVRTFVLAFLTACLGVLGEASAQDIILIPEPDLSYRTGDCRLDSNGLPEWTASYSASDWTSRDLLDRNALSAKRRLWVSFELPDIRQPHTGIYVSDIHTIFEVYYDSKRIYAFGELLPSGLGPFMGYRKHFIDVDGYTAGTRLFLRIHSHRKTVGLTGDILVGNQKALLKQAVRNDLDSMLFGSFFVVIGLFACAIYVKRRTQPAFLGFGLFALATGIHALSRTIVGELIHDGSFGGRYAIELFAVFVVPVGLTLLLENINPVPYGRVIRYFRYAHTLIVALVPLFVWLEITLLFGLLGVFQILALLAILCVGSIYTFAAARGSPEARTITAGLFILLLFGIYDLLNVGFFDWHEYQFWPIGVFVFTCIIGYILEKQYTAKAIESEREKARLQKVAFARAAAEKETRMKSRFFANISHEFRTPLTLILGNAEQLLEKVDEGTRRKLQSIILHGKKILRLVNQLLDLSRLESRSDGLRASRFPVHDFISKVSGAFESLAEQKGIRMTVEVEPEKQAFWIDPEKMEKVIGNLLSNALKFTPDGGRIDLRVRLVHPKDTPTGMVEISLSDSGVGIDAGELPYIFDRFYQVEGTHGRPFQGTGIGLSLARELVALHHGTIAVQSQPGEGTTFRILLPAGRDHLRPEELKEVQPSMSPGPAELENASILTPDDAVETAPHTGRRPQILIVDDHADMRRYLVDQLSPRFSVAQSHNGADALKTALRGQPELIISDIMMPEIDGLELTKRLKTNEMTCHIPVLLLTARALQMQKLEGLEHGADDYLTKPFDMQELHARVANLIESRRTLRTRFSRSITLSPSEVTASSLDEKLVSRVMAYLEEHMHDPELSVDQLAQAIGMSRSNLHRKLKALANLSPTDFIRSIRLKRAHQLLQQKSGTVGEIGYQVGFSNLSYFSRAFCSQFGYLPSKIPESS